LKKKHRNSKEELIDLALNIRSEKKNILIDAYSKLELAHCTAHDCKRKYPIKKKGLFLYTDSVPFEALPKTNLGLAIERRISLLEPLDFRY
jgi:heptosyltransferase-2